MAKSTISTVSFHGASLTVTSIDGVPHVALKPICDALSVDWTAQRRRLMRHPVLSEGVAITAIPSGRGDQETVLLPLDKLNGWLFGISAARVRDPARRERLVQYQRECFDVLAAHFGASRRAVRPVGQPMSGADVTQAMLDGLSEPNAKLTAEQRGLIDRRAWDMAGEAYQLARQHIERRIAYECSPAVMRDPESADAMAAVARCVDGVTLGNALAGKRHHQLLSIRRMARIASEMAADLAAAITYEQAPTPTAGQVGDPQRLPAHKSELF